MKYIKPRLDFINEAKANPVYQEKVRKEKAHVRKLIPSSIKIIPLIKELFFKGEYINFCHKYLIPETLITKTSLSLRIDNNNDGAFGSFNVDSTKSKAHEYAENIYGFVRFLSDLDSRVYSEKISEEQIGYPIKTGIKVIDYLSCSPFFFFNINVTKNFCQCRLEYSFNYYNYRKIEIKHSVHKVIENITKNDVNEIITQCLEESYNYCLSYMEHFDSLYSHIKKDMINIVKKGIIDSNYDMKLVGSLKHYPNILSQLNLDKDKVNLSGEMGELGF